MPFTFYILYSDKAQKFYIGFTGTDIQQRLKKHNTNHKGFTGKFGDWKIVRLEYFQTKQEAMKREKQVKAWKNAHKIKALIEASENKNR